MENMDKNLSKDLKDIAEMLEENLGLLKEVLEDVKNSSETERAVDDAAADAEEEKDTACPDIPTILQEAGYRNLKNILIPIPTVYGFGVIWKPDDMEAAIENLQLMLADDEENGNLDDFCWRPADFDKGNIILPNAKDIGYNKCKWLFFWLDSAYNESYTTRNASLYERCNIIVPVLTESISYKDAPVCYEDNVDMIPIALDCMDHLGILNFRLPYLFWKITKPGMQCKGTQYELGREYRFDGHMTLHEAGWHFATEPERLLSWYRPFSAENEIYIVQVGRSDNMAINLGGGRDKGIGVADSILFNKRIGWNEL